jgi:hypothetical protein
MHMARDPSVHLDHPGSLPTTWRFSMASWRVRPADEHWTAERACTGLPRLVHGDLKGKNLRVQASPAGSQIAAFDWADSGGAYPPPTSPKSPR